MPTNGASEDLRRLTIPAGPAVQQVLPALREMLAGRGPLILPMAPGERLEPATRSRYLRDVTGLAVGTSGSTGAKKRAVLPTAALRASIDATHDRLGGPGPWLLALPAHHIAGLQVLLRSLVAGVDPVVAPDGLPFPTGFAAAAAQLRAQGIDHPRWYTAVVPAQLPPLLDDPHASAALRRCAGVLCGGAALSSALRDQAQSAGVRLVTTYGMSETAGGCVYDGTPLAGVATSVQADRIWLGGPTVAAGYLDDPQRSAASFVLDAAGTRWFGTDDLGEVGPDGRLIVLGRRDDIINTGGYKVHPAVVETAIAAVTAPGTQAVVTGLAHPRWGHVVVAATALPARGIAAADLAPFIRTDELRPRLRELLPRYAVPRLIVQLPSLPSIGPGKVDRHAVAAALARYAVERRLPPDESPDPDGTIATSAR